MIKEILVKICLILCILLVLIGLTNSVNADMGPKPSITVKVVNMNTTDYLIDLLVYDETGKYYEYPPNYNGEGLKKEQIELLHNINYDGWISEGTRWEPYLLFADCAGNSEFEHRFGYFGTPTTYKIVIVNNETGKIKVSDVINREHFTSIIKIDANNMKVEDITVQTLISESAKSSIIPLIITVIVELLIALAFIDKRKRNFIIIFIANVITNIVFQMFMRINHEFFTIIFLIGEIIIVLVEVLTYIKLINTNSKSKIILYTIIANIITAILSIFIW